MIATNFDEYDNFLSPTSLIEKIRCGRLYYYDRILHLPKDEDQTALLFGKMAHSIFEFFYPNINENEAYENTYKYFLDILDSLKQKYWDFNIPQKLEPELDSILQKFAFKQSESFDKLAKKGKLDKFYPLATEKEIISKKYRLRCIIDCVNKNNTMSDYKTTKQFPEILLKDVSELTESEKEIYYEERLQYEIQAMINALCYEDEYGVFPTMMIYIFVRHLDNKEHGGLLPIMIDQELVDRIKPLINLHSEEINARIFTPTNNLNNCIKYKGCPYKEQCDSDNICWYSI